MTRLALILAAVLHLGFMVGEMVKWDEPYLLHMAVKDANDGTQPDGKLKFSDAEQELVATVVHNAGIYNFIVFAGFVWGLWPHCCGHRLSPDTVRAIRSFFFSAAIVAGAFGAVTMKNPVILAQAGVGLFGLLAVRLEKPNLSD